MKAWIRQHLAALSGAIRHFARSPGSFGLNILVVAFTLALPFAGLTILENVRPLSKQMAVEPEISIFLGVDVPRERVMALAPQIHRIVQDTQVLGKLEFISREDALTLLNNKTGLSEAVTALGENPLPDSYVLKLNGFQDIPSASRLENLAVRLKALPGVEYVQIDSAWVKRLAAFIHLARLFLLFLASMLSGVVIAVVFNTIRLQVMTQHKEIEVCRMFGATNTFIYRPFFYAGALLGLFSGVIAIGLVAWSLRPMNQAIADFARLYSAEFRLVPLNVQWTLGLLALSMALGVIGAHLSVRFHLNRLA